MTNSDADSSSRAVTQNWAGFSDCLLYPECLQCVEDNLGDVLELRELIAMDLPKVCSFQNQGKNGENQAMAVS